VASALFDGTAQSESLELRTHRGVIAEALEHADMLPRDLRAGLVRYVSDGIRPGHFLCAVLDNDLTDAVGRADSPARLLELVPVVSWLFNHAPSTCYGSKAKRLEWEKRVRELTREVNGG
jgi:hypothetical protein